MRYLIAILVAIVIMFYMHISENSQIIEPIEYDQKKECKKKCSVYTKSISGCYSRCMGN